MTDHLRAPWTYDEVQGGVIDNGGWDVAEVSASTLRSEHRAAIDARGHVIAAAPDMLDALRHLLAMQGDDPDVWAEAHRAVERAEGRAS